VSGPAQSLLKPQALPPTQHTQHTVSRNEVTTVKLLRWGIVALIGLYLITQPADAARAVKAAAGGLGSAGDSLSQFVNALGDDSK
jgi:hypothetical protein